MDEVLLESGREASSSGGYNRVAYPNRKAAITSEDPFVKAAALVDLAEDGVGLPPEVLDAPSFDQAIKSYFIFIKLDIIWFLNLLALLLLNFLEAPLWCTNKSSDACKHRSYYFLGELPYLSSVQCLIYEVVTTCVLVVHTFFPVSYVGYQLFWKTKLNIFRVVCLGLLLVDLLLDVLFVVPGPIDHVFFKIAPYVRVIILVLNVRELRECIQTLAGMVTVYLNTLALLLLFLLFSSWVGYVIFEDTTQGKEIFTSYGSTLYQMFLLFTISNNPDVWIPAYKASRVSCLFFVIYILFGVYFITNLILAVVYDSFKQQLAKTVAKKDALKEAMLSRAFDYIDQEQCGFLSKNQCNRLLHELTKYRTLPKFLKEDFDLIFDELDDNYNFQIDKAEFSDLCHAISLQFEKEPQISWFQKYEWYGSASCNCVRDFVKSNAFDYIVIFVLLLNLVTVLIETTLDIENDSAQYFWQKVEFCFGWVYVIEMALKIFSWGFDAYWREGQNRFDFVITWIIVIGETLTFIFPHGLPILSNAEWIRYLLIARLLRLTRILLKIAQYQNIMATFFTLIPSLTPYFVMIFCVISLYCSLGVQLFGGLVYSGNPKLEGLSLKENDYVLFNFNDYPNGMVTLFNMMVMGNWQICMESYVQLSETSWALVYFISFYLVTVLFMLNLVIAFVLEAFFAERDIKSGDVDQARKDSGTMYLKASQKKRVRSEARSGRVDRLLHQILSEELKETTGNSP